jgi:hypothetical protein
MAKSNLNERRSICCGGTYFFIYFAAPTPQMSQPTADRVKRVRRALFPDDVSSFLTFVNALIFLQRGKTNSDVDELSYLDQPSTSLRPPTTHGATPIKQRWNFDFQQERPIDTDKACNWQWLAMNPRNVGNTAWTYPIFRCPSTTLAANMWRLFIVARRSLSTRHRLRVRCSHRTRVGGEQTGVVLASRLYTVPRECS